jgi:hypothetical protein
MNFYTILGLDFPLVEGATAAVLTSSMSQDWLLTPKLDRNFVSERYKV